MRKRYGIIKRINFEKEKIGIYTESKIKREWNNPLSFKGVNEERVNILHDNGKKVMQIKYLKGKLGPKEGGAQWRLFFDKSHKELYVQYKVMFPKVFNFVKGGKLPGLCGGTMPVGGRMSIGGFSARIMWRGEGVISQYIYYSGKDSSKKWGEDFIWKYSNEKKVYMLPGKWHTLKTRIKLGVAGKKDDLIESWFDGKKVLKSKLNLRGKGEKFKIDSFNFTTFFGGNDETWIPVKDEYVYFDDFIFSKKDIPFETKK